jgi:hypothetical protein
MAGTAPFDRENHHDRLPLLQHLGEVLICEGDAHGVSPVLFDPGQQEMSFVEESIGTDALVLAEILEGVVGVQRFHGHAVFLVITRGMQSTGVAAIDLRELQPVLEL